MIGFAGYLYIGIDFLLVKQGHETKVDKIK